MNREKSHDLGIRTLINGSSAVLIALLIFLAHYPALRWIFAAAVSFVGGIAVGEYDRLVKKKGLFPARGLSITFVMLYILSVFIKIQGHSSAYSSFWLEGPKIILVLAFLSCFVYFAVAGLPPITHIATTFLGIIYTAVPLGLFVSIMYFFTHPGLQEPIYEGTWWIIYLIAVTKSADIGGYFIGNAFGKRKLAFKLSPKKTLEGALGGLLGSTLMSLGICYLGKRYGGVFAEFSYVQSLWIGALVGIVGQMGDLAESLLKRDAGVKDSNSIPGVGGILDMIDSLLFTAPVIYIFLKIIYH